VQACYADANAEADVYIDADPKVDAVNNRNGPTPMDNYNYVGCCRLLGALPGG